MTTTISIIGSSGHRETLDRKTFETAHHNLNKWFDESKYMAAEVILKSGGSSGIDHLAVMLFLTGYFAGLVIHLPCGFNVEKKRFYSKNKYDVRAASLLNELHEQFSKEIGRDTFADIQQCLAQKNCSRDTDFGFFKRNTKVAQSNVIVAMTFAKGAKPSDGGTLDTWSKAKTDQKFHISLSK